MKPSLEQRFDEKFPVPQILTPFAHQKIRAFLLDYRKELVEEISSKIVEEPPFKADEIIDRDEGAVRLYKMAHNKALKEVLALLTDETEIITSDTNN